MKEASATPIELLRLYSDHDSTAFGQLKKPLCAHFCLPCLVFYQGYHYFKERALDPAIPRQDQFRNYAEKSLPVAPNNRGFLRNLHAKVRVNLTWELSVRQMRAKDAFLSAVIDRARSAPG